MQKILYEIKTDYETKKLRIKFLIAGVFFVSFSSIAVLFISPINDAARIISYIIFSIFILFGLFFLLLVYLSGPFKITEEGLFYPPPPFPTWSFKQALKYHFIPFSKIREIVVSDQTIRLKLKNSEELVIYSAWIFADVTVIKKIICERVSNCRTHG